MEADNEQGRAGDQEVGEKQGEGGAEMTVSQWTSISTRGMFNDEYTSSYVFC